MMHLADTVGFGPDTVRVDKSYTVFNHYFDLPVHQGSEIFVPYEDAAEAVRTIRDVVVKNRFPVNYVTEVYTECCK